jgi:hypothetical protein
VVQDNLGTLGTSLKIWSTEYTHTK